MKLARNVKIWAGVSAFVAFAIAIQVYACVKDREIMQKGVTLKAKIVRASFSRGYNITFEYTLDGHRHTNSGNTDDFTFEAGDSMVFKILPSELEGQFHIVKVCYRPTP